ncbi:translation initiation factor IF-3 [Patescibacteria group bacterium]|nr:translation initiation factor IF-3 [Patescibacteria group bacterium]
MCRPSNSSGDPAEKLKRIEGLYPSYKSQTNLQKRIFINNQIRATEVRLVDETGKQVGVVPIKEALEMAQERELDLIQVTKKVDPPVCKIGNYGKYLYQQEKKAKDATKKQTGGELKEIRLTYNMSPHDLETRAKQAEKFLQKGDRVRITLPLRGRQKAMEGYARDKIGSFLEGLGQTMSLKTERDLKREPRGLSMIVIKR